MVTFLEGHAPGRNNLPMRRFASRPSPARRSPGAALLAYAALAGAATMAPPALADGLTGMGQLRPPVDLAPRAGEQRSHSETRWIVAAEADAGALADRLARRHGLGVVDAGLRIYAGPLARARAFADALRRHRALWYAEPDIRGSHRALPADPLSNLQWWSPRVVPPELVPPPPGGPPVAVVDSGADLAHPDLAGHVIPGAAQRFDHDPGHGTGVTSVVSAAANGVGIVGVLPGQQTIIFPSNASCAETVRMVRLASTVSNVINMSYGFDGGCFSHLVATQLAISRNVLPIAAAGNEFQEGNPLSRPANDPHVLNVGAVNPDLSSAMFSNENIGVDLVAPGVNIPVAAPTAASPSGYELASGTSFSAPIVTALASWLRRARPGLDAIQTADAFRASATDLGAAGYDPAFGFGLVDIAGALTVAKPPREPREPNEDIAFVTGRTFGQAPLLAGRRREAHQSFLDSGKDAVDVIPIRIRPRSRVRIDLRPRGADVDIEVFSRRARTVFYEGRPPRTVLARSVSAGTRRERVTIENRGRVAQKVFAAVYIGDDRELSAAYRLSASTRALPAG